MSQVWGGLNFCVLHLYPQTPNPFMLWVWCGPITYTGLEEPTVSWVSNVYYVNNNTCHCGHCCPQCCGTPSFLTSSSSQCHSFSLLFWPVKILRRQVHQQVAIPSELL